MKLVVIDVHHGGKDPMNYCFLVQETFANSLNPNDPLAAITDSDWVGPIFQTMTKCKKWAKTHKHKISYTMKAIGY